MLYNVVERKKHGNRQINRLNLPFSLLLRGWESTRLLFEAGKIDKTTADKYKYICSYDPEDWQDEELNILDQQEYFLN
ncbi:MAG: hypothetical protein KAS32_08665 [Candidatus Peribacteraceae bacterium]|nr:hypothetical protein [Candidatus Peribacteraceae bacterium]